jgi:hypothetical protein
MLGTRAYIVRAHRPWRERLVALLAIVVLVGTGYLLFAAGHAQGRGEHLAMQGNRDSVLGLNAHLRKQAQSLREALETSDAGSLVTANAFSESRRALARQQGELGELREELAFYKGLAHGSGSAESLTIRNLRLERRSGEGYNFVLTLTRVVSAEAPATGEFELRIMGRRATQSVTIPMLELAGTTAPWRFEFSTFGRFDGELTIPSDVTPARVLVRVKLAGIENDPGRELERSFEWPVELL